jgi:hypothetical protein
MLYVKCCRKSTEPGQLSDYGLDERGIGVRFLEEQEGSLFSILSRPTLGSTQVPPIQWEPGAVFPLLRRKEREVDHSTAFSAEVKNI